MRCPLCGDEGAACLLPERAETTGRGADSSRLGAYRQCPVCGLVFLPPAFHPSREQERRRYLAHRNSLEDEGYRAHLSRTLDPLLEVLEASSRVESSGGRGTLRGLDFGCGPTPAVETLLAERGWTCASYDPFFADHPQLLDERYDFVVAIEVVEHLRRPAETWALFDRLLEAGGWLAVGTMILSGGIDFEQWWYRRDLTHLCFYRPRTMEWIAHRFGWTMREAGANVRLFGKPPEGRGTGRSGGVPLARR